MKGFVDKDHPKKAPYILAFEPHHENRHLFYVDCKRYNQHIVQDILNKLGLVMVNKLGDGAKPWFYESYWEETNARFRHDPKTQHYSTQEQ